MLNLTKAIYAKLAGSALASDIGGRLHKGRAPEGTEYPYVVYMVISDVPEKTFTEDFENVVIQFSLFSATQSSSNEVETMFADLKTLYDECSLTITGSTLLRMKRAIATLMVEDHTLPPPHGTVEVWHNAVDYEVLLETN